MRRGGKKAALSPEETEAARVRIVADYNRYLADTCVPGTEPDPKGFTARHAAARAALNHLDQLSKMAGDEASDDAEEASLAAARAARAADDPGDDESGDEP